MTPSFPLSLEVQLEPKRSLDLLGETKPCPFSCLNRESKPLPRSLTSTNSPWSEPFGSELKADLLRVEDSRVAVGLASVLKNGKFPYGRRSLQVAAGIFNLLNSPLIIYLVTSPKSSPQRLNVSVERFIPAKPDRGSSRAPSEATTPLSFSSWAAGLLISPFWATPLGAQVIGAPWTFSATTNGKKIPQIVTKKRMISCLGFPATFSQIKATLVIMLSMLGILFPVFYM